MNTSSKDRLLASGTQLFAEKGFDGVSVREICAHADTSINMIHHYFKNKQGLYRAILDKFSARVFRVPVRILATEPQSKQDFQARVEVFFEETLEALIEQRLLLKLVVMQAADLDAISTCTGEFAAFLEKGKQRGFVRAELDTEMIGGCLSDRLLNQILFASAIKQSSGCDLFDPDYKQRWCKSNLDLFLNGILA